VIIKEPQRRPGLVAHLLRSLKEHKVLFGFLMLVGYSTLVFILGALAHRAGLMREVTKLLSYARMETAMNYVKGLTAQPERITIDIKYKELEKLRYKREMALARGILMAEPDDFVPARIRYQDKNIKVRLRLKGDNLDHLLGDKWSFRVKVRGDMTLFGMKQFSIQHPKTRDYLYEWLFHQIARREGLLFLRYKFVKVTVNGKDWGLYALEEHFEKRLIESNQRREGPIIKFDESMFWAERLDFKNFIQNGDASRALPGLGSYTSMPLDMFQTTKTTSDPLLLQEYVMAQNLLEQFRRGDLSTSQVFEVDALARYIALCDLFGTNHPLHTNQFRFYYNPVLSLLEPIPFDINDINVGKTLMKLAGTYTEEDDTYWDGGGRALFLSRLFKDNAFWEAYLKALKRFSEPSYLDTLFNELDDALTQNLNEIYSEFSWYHFSKEVLYQNQEYIRKFLDPVRALYAYYYGGDAQRIVLQIGNIHQVPIEILDVSYKNLTRFERHLVGCHGWGFKSPIHCFGDEWIEG
jgi:hypothetical protein